MTEQELLRRAGRATNLPLRVRTRVSVHYEIVDADGDVITRLAFPEKSPLEAEHAAHAYARDLEAAIGGASPPDTL